MIMADRRRSLHAMKICTAGPFLGKPLSSSEFQHLNVKLQYFGEAVTGSLRYTKRCTAGSGGIGAPSLAHLLSFSGRGGRGPSASAHSRSFLAKKILESESGIAGSSNGLSGQSFSLLNWLPNVSRSGEPYVDVTTLSERRR